jgi:hypothetical protein
MSAAIAFCRAEHTGFAHLLRLRTSHIKCDGSAQSVVWKMINHSILSSYFDPGRSVR